jgi:hypothetical protein
MYTSVFSGHVYSIPRCLVVRLTSLFSRLVYLGVSNCEYLGVYRSRLPRCVAVLITSLLTRSSLPRCLPVVFTSVLYNHLYLGLFTSVFTSHIYLPRCLLVMFPRYLPIVFTSVFTSRDYLYFYKSSWSQPVGHLVVYQSSLLYLGVYRSLIARPLKVVLTSVFSSRSKTASMLFWWLFHRSENTCSNIIFLHALITFLRNLHTDRHDYLVLELSWNSIANNSAKIFSFPWEKLDKSSKKVKPFQQ